MQKCILFYCCFVHTQNVLFFNNACSVSSVFLFTELLLINNFLFTELVLCFLINCAHNRWIIPLQLIFMSIHLKNMESVLLLCEPERVVDDIFLVFVIMCIVIVCLCNSVLGFSMFQLVFSSSATVYGWPKEVPCTEESPLCATNPYGRTKVWIRKQMLDCTNSNAFKIISFVI